MEIEDCTAVALKKAGWKVRAHHYRVYSVPRFVARKHEVLAGQELVLEPAREQTSTLVVGNLVKLPKPRTNKDGTLVPLRFKVPALTLEARGGRTEVELIDPNGKSFKGVAYCSDKDNYNNATGIQVAIGHALVLPVRQKKARKSKKVVSKRK